MPRKSEVHDLKELITKGKKQGYLTYEELNNALPEGDVSAEQIDEMMMVFDELDIEIMDGKKITLARDEIGEEGRLKAKPGCLEPGKGQLRTCHGSGKNVSSRNGFGFLAEPRRRSGNRQTDRGRRTGNIEGPRGIYRRG